MALIALSVAINVATLTAALASTETVTYYLKGTAAAGGRYVDHSRSRPLSTISRPWVMTTIPVGRWTTPTRGFWRTTKITTSSGRFLRMV